MKGLWIVIGVAACTSNGSGGPDVTLVELENEGVVCIHADNTGTFLEDQPIEVAVDWETCLSGSCTAQRTTSCMATAVGSTITIDTYASWLDTTRTQTACTADCNFMMTTCETPPLAAGEYTFVFQGRSIGVTVPSTVMFNPCLR